MRISVRKCVSVCGKVRISVRKSAYQCAGFSLVEGSAPITPYTPKGYGVVAHAPWGGAGNPRKERGLPGREGNSKKDGANRLLEMSYHDDQKFCPPRGCRVNFKMPEEARAQGRRRKERVTVCGFLSGRRLCPNYPVYSKRVWGGCPDRRTMDYALPNPTCLDVGKNDKLSFLRGCLSQMDGVLGGVNGYATLLGGGWPGCSPGLLFGPRRRVIR